MLSNVSWHGIPDFIEALIREVHEESIDRVWHSKDMDKGLEEYRKQHWKHAKRGKKGYASKQETDKLKQMEQKVRLRELDIEDLEL